MTGANRFFSAYGYTNGRLTNRSTNYNVASVYLYQANGRVVAVDHANASARLSHETYGYYGNGQLSWFVRNGDAATNALNNGTGDAYGYQADGQLNSMGYHITNPYSSTNFDGDNPSAEVWNHPSREDAYGYDAAGNRTVDNEGGAYVAPGFDAENRQSGTGYDANGNCTVAGYRGSTYTYVYDAQNQLMGASGGGNSLSFGYDPKGRLVQRTINGVTTWLHYAGDQVVEEDDVNNHELRSYLYGAGGERTFLIDGTLTQYLYDGRGWLSQLTDINGSLIEQYLYDAFGQPRVYNAAGTRVLGSASTLAGGGRFLWNAGYEWYPEMGLYRCGARFYSPALGRFMQPDPIGQSGGLNIYGYCGNDPINGSDPSGLLGTETQLPKQNAGILDFDGNPNSQSQGGDNFSNQIYGQPDSDLHADIPEPHGSTSSGGSPSFSTPSVSSGSGLLQQLQQAAPQPVVTPWSNSIPLDKIIMGGGPTVINVSIHKEGNGGSSVQINGTSRYLDGYFRQFASNNGEPLTPDVPPGLEGGLSQFEYGFGYRNQFGKGQTYNGRSTTMTDQPSVPSPSFLWFRYSQANGRQDFVTFFMERGVNGYGNDRPIGVIRWGHAYKDGKYSNYGAGRYTFP